MSRLRVLDRSYLDHSILFSEDRQTILRRLDGSNRFLADDDIRRMLIDHHVVDYEIAQYDGKEYIEVHPFFFPNSAANWSYSMFKDYIFIYEQLYHELEKYGMTLIDGHCFNIVFYHARPKFIDLGSIRKGSQADGPKDMRRYKKALLSYRSSSARYTRQRLDTELENPTYLDVLKDLVVKDDHVSRRHKFLRMFGFRQPTIWSHYYGGSQENYSDTPKTEVIRNILMSAKPKTVYDVGCNTGYYSFIAESCGAKVVACDPDPDCIDYLYKRVKEKDARILPLVADIDGLIRAIHRPYECLRMKSVDVVMMLALVHHLVFRSGYDFDKMFDRVRQIGANSLILEFVSKKDVHVQEWDRQTPREWYTLEQLYEAGKKYFTKYELYDEHDAERPIIYFHGPASR